jgi:hypothetical protein
MSSRKNKKPRKKSAWNEAVSREMSKLKNKGIAKGNLFKQAVANAKKTYKKGSKSKPKRPSIQSVIKQRAQPRQPLDKTKTKSAWKKAVSRSKPSSRKLQRMRRPANIPLPIDEPPIISGRDGPIRPEQEKVIFDLEREREEKIDELPVPTMHRIKKQNVLHNNPQPLKPATISTKATLNKDASNKLVKPPPIPRLSKEQNNFFAPINKEQYSAQQPQIRNQPKKRLFALGNAPSKPSRFHLKGKARIDFEAPRTDKISGQTRNQKMLSNIVLGSYKKPIPENKIKKPFREDTRPIDIEQFQDGWQVEDYLRQIMNQNNKLSNVIPIENLDYQDGAHININPSGEYVQEEDNFEWNFPESIIPADMRGRPLNLEEPIQRSIVENDPENVAFETHKPNFYVEEELYDEPETMEQLRQGPQFPIYNTKQFVATDRPRIRQAYQTLFPHQKVLVQDVPEVSTYRNPLEGNLPSDYYPYIPDRETEEAMARFMMGNPFKAERAKIQEQIKESQKKEDAIEFAQKEYRKRQQYPRGIWNEKGRLKNLQKDYEMKQWMRRHGIPDVSKPKNFGFTADELGQQAELVDELETMEDLQQGPQPIKKAEKAQPRACRLKPKPAKKPKPRGIPDVGSAKQIEQQLRKSREKRKGKKKVSFASLEEDARRKEERRKQRKPLRAKRRTTQRKQKTFKEIEAENLRQYLAEQKPLPDIDEL